MSASDVARVAALLGDPTRARVCLALMDGRARTARELGAEAGVAACAHGEVHHLRRASHWVQHEEPDEVNRLLLRFLA